MTQQPEKPWTVSVAPSPGTPPCPELDRLDLAIRKGREPRHETDIAAFWCHFWMQEAFEMFHRSIPEPTHFTGIPVRSQCNAAVLERFLAPILACGTLARGLVMPTGTFIKPARGRGLFGDETPAPGVYVEEMDT